MESTILVAEDSPTQAERLRLLLENEGYRVEVVRNGREGLDRVKLTPPDLIISDVVMPQMDGYAFCRAVKSTETLRRIPFVLLTERNTPADIVKGFERGADNFITKPFEDEHLLERVKRIFEHLELRRQGRLDVEISLNVGGRAIVINADKQQMIELLFATLEELARLNGRLGEAQRTVEEYARSLEAKVEERNQQLQQAEKIATMGQLLAGVAHELNNPLSVVLGHCTMLRTAPGQESVAQRAEKISRAAERCARIVKNFLALARQRPPERQVVLLNQVVQEAVELLGYPLRVDGIEVLLALADNLPPLWADPNQLHQVIVNLVTNAHHAMRATTGARRLTLTTRLDPPRNRVRLDVADTGTGIPPEIQARIFEPFFTTKPLGQGTGLGLSLCQGIVATHGGMMSLESGVNEGTVFSIELPVETPPEAAFEATPAAGLPVAAGKRILVVDDEPEVSDMLTEWLAADGHQPVAVTDGAAALDLIRRERFDLILTDMRMPRLDGPGLYRELKRQDPELARHLIFLTGDTLSPDVAQVLAESGLPSVAKPFDLEEVLRVVRRALR